MPIHGEVDVSTRALFAAMLQATIDKAGDGAGPTEAHVDLGGLDFVGGGRALVTAGTGRGPESQLVIHRPPALLARILAVGCNPLAALRFEA